MTAKFDRDQEMMNGSREGARVGILLWQDEPMVHVKFGSNLDTLVLFFNSNRQILAEKAKKLMINEKQLGNGERAEVENLGQHP